VAQRNRGGLDKLQTLYPEINHTKSLTNTTSDNNEDEDEDDLHQPVP
jgi:hypothetical protein